MNNTVVSVGLLTTHKIRILGRAQAFVADCLLILLAGEQFLKLILKRKMDHELFRFAVGVITIATTQITHFRGVIWTPNFTTAFDADAPMQVNTFCTSLL